jgi:uncharacterized protein YebE (UPF0316 family)
MSGSEILTMTGISILIFCARILDVSLDTMRIIFISRGSRLIPPLLGFFEVLIWLLAITQIFRNLNGFVYYVAYAGGFAMGNFVGICIERKLAVGNLIIRVITGKDSTELLNHLNNEGFGFTTVNAEGSQGSVKIIFMVIKRRNLEKVSDIVKRLKKSGRHVKEYFHQEKQVFSKIFSICIGLYTENNIFFVICQI